MKCKEIFWMSLSIMKGILSLAEFKMGKNTDEYRYFKKEVMNQFYNNLKIFFDKLLEEGEIKKCECLAKLRKGYSKCNRCGGSGYRNKQK